jgi:hypothetical protein
MIERTAALDRLRNDPAVQAADEATRAWLLALVEFGGGEGQAAGGGIAARERAAARCDRKPDSAGRK